MLQDERRIRRFLIEEVDRKARLQGRPVRFVQVGANDGVTDDPLSEFILRGNWHGVLVEPVRSAFEALRKNYATIEGLTFLNVAVAEKPGEAEIFTCGNSRVSSLDRAFVERKSGGTPVESYVVPLVSLSSVIERHVPDGVDILVIDAEGYDAVILATVDFAVHHPKVIIFESHNISKDQFDSIQKKVESRGYIFIRMHADTAAFAAGEIEFGAEAAGMLEKIVAEDVAKSKRLREIASKKPDRTSVYERRLSIKTSSDAVREPRSKVDGGKAGSLSRWYFSINKRGIEQNFEDLQVTVISAVKNTKLVPICIYNGPECEQLEWLRAHGVQILQRESSIKRQLLAGYGKDYDAFSAHWLRTDIPDIESEHNLVLYTDVDVMFLEDPASYIFGPRYIAASEEMKLGERGHFNSGVMVLNNRNLRVVMPWFKQAIRTRLEHNFEYPPHDQWSFNEFFGNTVSWLDPRFNWKPYWGVNPDAAIVHFHGPKPNHIGRLRRDLDSPMKKSFKALYSKNVEGYQHYTGIYNNFLSLAKSSTGSI